MAPKVICSTCDEPVRADGHVRHYKQYHPEHPFIPPPRCWPDGSTVLINYGDMEPDAQPG